MRKLLQSMLLMAAIVLPWASQAQCPSGETSCQITIQMTDDYGDGWFDYDGYQFYIKVYQGTTLRGSVSLADGLSGSQTVSICTGDSIRFVMDGEDYYEESSFVILNGDGSTILSGDCSDYDDGDVIITAAPTCPSCPAPTNLAVSAFGADYAIIKWVGNGNYGYIFGETTDVNAGTVASSSTTVDSVEFSNLNSSTSYTFKLWSDCTTEFSDTLTLTFATLGNVVSSFPYSTSFEEGDDTAWTFTNGSNGWYIGSATSNGTGSRALYISSDNGTSNAYNNSASSTSFAYRYFNISEAGDYAISFDWKCNAESGYDYLRAYIAPATAQITAATTPASNWINLSGDLVGQNSWQNLSMVGNMQIGSYILLFYWTNDGSFGTNPPAAIDNVYINKISCPAPTNFAITGTTTDEITLSWTAGGNETNWELIMGSDTTPISSNPYTVTGLAANTVYNFTLRADCGNDDYSLSVSTSGRTACDVLDSLPYSTSFESVDLPSGSNQLPLCWTRYNDGTTENDYQPYAYNYSTYANTGSYSLYWAMPTATGRADTVIAVLPAIDASNYPMDENRLTFYARSNGDVQLYVGTMSDPYDASTFTAQDSFLVSSSNYTRFICAFTDAESDNEYAAIMRVKTSVNNSLYIDDVTLEVAPACADVTGLTFDSMSATSASFHWNNTHSAYELQLINGADTITETSISDNFVTVNGLVMDNSYTVRLRGDCGGDYSAWSAPISVYIGYCQPTPSSVDNQGISQVVFGDFMVMDNTQRPTSSPYYGNYASLVGGYAAGDSANVAITYRTGYSYGTIIWVDWNNNLSFDAEEVVYAGQSTNANPTTINCSFLIADTVAEGTYRMRIAGADSYYDSYTSSITAAANADPCPQNTSYCVVHDYTLFIGAEPTCVNVTDVTVEDVTANTVTVSWRDTTNTGASYKVFVNGTLADDNISDTAYTATGLAANTNYTITVVTDCGSDTSFGVGVSTRTACGSIATSALPWIENFDSYSTGNVSNNLPCWTHINPVSTTNNYVDISSSYYYNGNRSLRFTYSSSTGSVIALPAFDTALSALQLSFMHRPESITNSNCGTLKVGYVTNVSDASSFVAVDQWNYNDFTSADFRNQEVFFAGAPDNARIAFCHVGNNYNWYWFIDSVNVHLAPDCLPVNNLTATFVDDDEITVSFGAADNADVALWITNGTTTVDSLTVNTNNYTFSNLTASTNYTIYAAVDCGGMLSNALSISVATSATPDTLPYATGFETTDDNAWSFANGTPNGWTIGNGRANNSTRGLYVSNDGSTFSYTPSSASDIYAYKLLRFDAGEYAISYDWIAMGDDSYHFLRAFLAPASTSFTAGENNGITASGTPNGWIALDNGYMSGDTSAWHTVNNVVNIPANALYNLVFYWSNDSYANTHQFPAAVDNVSVAALSCMTPDSLTVSNITTSSADIAWTPRGTETSWELVVNDTTSIITNTASYSLTGLIASTQYSVKVRAICGSNDTSFFTDNEYFWTNCIDEVAPWTALFNTTSLSPCWRDSVMGTSTPIMTWANSLANGYGYIYSVAAYTNTPADDWLVTPAIQIPANATDFNLVYQVAGIPYYSGYSNTSISYDVFVSPTGADNIAAFTDSITSEDNINMSNFEYRTFSMAAYAGQTVRVAFRNRSTQYGMLGLYEVAIRQTNEPLYIVYGPNTTFVGDTTSWKAQYQMGDLTGMTYSWTSTMAQAGQANAWNTNTDSVSIVYNAAGTDLITFVATNAYGSDTITFNVTAFNCGIIDQLPYIDSFEVEDPCWIKVYANGDPTINPIVLSSTQAHSGNYSLRFSSYSSGQPYDQYYISPEIAGTEREFSFWYRNYGYNDMIRVGYSSTTNDTAAFNWTDWLTTSTSSWSQYLDSLPDTVKYVALHYYGDYAYYVYVDDLRIDGVVSGCSKPNALAVSNVNYNSANFSWNGNASSYQVAVKAATEATWPAETTVNTNAYAASNLSAATAYAFRVRSLCDDNETSDWVVINFTTDSLPCMIPSDFQTTTVGYTTATFAWTANGNENQWAIHVWDNNGSNEVEVSSNPATVTGLLANHTYNAAVKAICGNGAAESEYSDTIQFTTSACAQVTGVTATNVTATSATLSWNPTGAANYRIEYGEIGFSQGDGNTVEITGTTHTLTGLSPETQYTAYVRAICETGVEGDWSAAVNFETSTEGISTVDGGINLAIYPNPTSDATTITLSGVNGEVSIVIVDMNGRIVKSDTMSCEGDCTKRMEVSGLAQGAYFVRVSGDGVSRVKKLIVK